MPRYIQISKETGEVISDSYLSGKVEAENMIAVADDFELGNKRYIDGQWVECEPATEE